jgi:hypothetical protein
MPHLTDYELLLIALGDEPADAHLGDCEQCRAELARLRELMAVGKQTEELAALPLPGEHIWAGIATATGLSTPDRRRAATRFGLAETDYAATLPDQATLPLETVQPHDPASAFPAPETVRPRDLSSPLTAPETAQPHHLSSPSPAPEMALEAQAGPAMPASDIGAAAPPAPNAAGRQPAPSLAEIDLGLLPNSDEALPSRSREEDPPSAESGILGGDGSTGLPSGELSTGQAGPPHEELEGVAPSGSPRGDGLAIPASLTDKDGPRGEVYPVGESAPLSGDASTSEGRRWGGGRRPSEARPHDEGRTSGDSRPAGEGRRGPGRKARRGWRRTVLVAVLAAVIGGAGTWAVLTRVGQPPVTASAALSAYGQAPGNAAGEAQVLGESTVRVKVSGLPQAAGYYEVWLIDPGSLEMFSIGVLGAQAEAEFSLPPNVDLSKYKLVDVSAEEYDNDSAHSGDSLLRGTLG